MTTQSISFDDIHRMYERFLLRAPVVVRFLIPADGDECLAAIRHASSEVGIEIGVGVPVEENRFVPRRMIVAVMSDDSLRLIKVEERT